MTGSSVNNQTPIVSNTEPAGDFSTMRYMFATNAPNTAGNNLNQFGFNTSVNQKQPSSGLDFDWSAASSQPKQPQNVNLNINLNTSTTAPVVPNESNFSTLQGLFATNSLGVNQPVIQQQQQPVQQNFSQSNFNLNAQHFATQQIPSQSFGTSYNVNPQNFGTQNFMGQNVPSQ